MDAQTTINKKIPTPDLLPEVSINKDVLKLYANGFQCGATLGDSSIILRLNDAPIALVSMSLPAMKSLHNQLGTILEAYSKGVTSILSFEELQQTVSKK